MKIDLSGRAMIVTGGTKGVGRAAVLKLVESGADVAFQGRDARAADDLIKSLGNLGHKACFVAGDLYDPDDLERLAATAIDRFGRIDGAIGSGMSPGGGIRLFRDVAAADVLGYFQSGAVGRILLLHTVLRSMTAAGYGKVVFVTTDAGRVPTPGESLIGAAAAAVIYFTRAAARELARDNIRVNTLSITITRGTPGYDKFEVKRRAGEVDVHTKVFDKIEGRAPFGLGTATEAAEVAAFLLAPESDGITGATFSINQGAYFPTYA